MSPIQEAGKTARGFMDALKEEPLSLALCAMNLLLLGYMFYEGSSVSAQRQSALERIVEWQRDTDKLMASCVSVDVMKLVVDALERDRELYRRLLPQHARAAVRWFKMARAPTDGNGYIAQTKELELARRENQRLAIEVSTRDTVIDQMRATLNREEALSLELGASMAHHVRTAFCLGLGIGVAVCVIAWGVLLLLR